MNPDMKSKFVFQYIYNTVINYCSTLYFLSSIMSPINYVYIVLSILCSCGDKHNCCLFVDCAGVVQSTGLQRLRYSCLWFCLGNKRALIKVQERLCFRLNVDNPMGLKSPWPKSFPNFNQLLPVPKHNHKNVNAVVSTRKDCITRVDI